MNPPEISGGRAAAITMGTREWFSDIERRDVFPANQGGELRRDAGSGLIRCSRDTIDNLWSLCLGRRSTVLSFSKGRSRPMAGAIDRLWLSTALSQGSKEVRTQQGTAI